jgi:hypothetical protein
VNYVESKPEKKKDTLIEKKNEQKRNKGKRKRSLLVMIGNMWNVNI